jgi:hypothetical protein
MILFALKYWRWLALAGALAAGGFYVQHVKAASYRQGAADREESALKEAAAKVEKDTAARKADLDQREADLDMQEAKTQGERAALNTARAGINSALSAGLSQLATQGVDIRNEIHDVPDSAVSDRFRVALARARQYDSQRAAGTVQPAVP